MRGCGDRVEDTPYFETELSPDGDTPITDYMHCHPKLVSPDLMRQIPNRGVMTFEKDGITHVVDRIGAGNYKCGAFVYELMVKGMSRKSHMGFDFSLITRASRYILVHPQAIIGNANEYYEHMMKEMGTIACPINDDHYSCIDMSKADTIETCYRHWVCDHDEPADDSHYQVGDLYYRGFPRHKEISPAYLPGIIAALPITGICMIDGENANENLEAIRSTGSEIESYIKKE